MSSNGAQRLSAAPLQPVAHGVLLQRLHAAIVAAGGWLPFDRFMHIALYEPGRGYYAHGSRKFGALPSSGSDFITAPELSPLFGQALARQVAQALAASGTAEIFEFGAGSGALAAQLLQALGAQVARYCIVDVSGSLRARQAERLAPWAGKVEWLDAWPDRIDGVVVGNEVLDAMPVQLLHWDGNAWLERGVVARLAGRLVGRSADSVVRPVADSVVHPVASVAPHDEFAWADRPTDLHPPGQHAFVPGTVTEIHQQAEAFVQSLAQRLQRGAAFFIDYGFPEHEYYHPQRTGGTLMCHRAHRADTDPLNDVGDKDITAHVNFSGIALAAQDAGLHVLGYTSQARFLFNCGLVDLLHGADVRTTAAAQKLVNEHEMGELFKVIGLSRGVQLDAIGFSAGDRSHTL